MIYLLFKLVITLSLRNTASLVPRIVIIRKNDGEKKEFHINSVHYGMHYLGSNWYKKFCKI